MEIEFEDPDLERLAFDASFIKGSAAIVKAYRKRINQIIQSPSRTTLYSFKSLRLEKLKGSRSDQHSMRINDQYRLVIEFRAKNKHEIVVVIRIEDYH